LLISQDVCVSVVVEDVRHHRDPILGGRGQFLHGKHESAVGANGDDGAIWICDLGT
jgi:hypothetical protein